MLPSTTYDPSSCFLLPIPTATQLQRTAISPPPTAQKLINAMPGEHLDRRSLWNIKCHLLFGAPCRLLHNFPYWSRQGTRPPSTSPCLFWMKVGRQTSVCGNTPILHALAFKMEACTSKTLATSPTFTQHNNQRTELTITHCESIQSVTSYTPATLNITDTATFVLFPQKPQTNLTHL
jgi:hypothetical protein